MRKAILLDWDGVLCNSLELYFDFYLATCRRFGRPFPIADLEQFRVWYNPRWEETFYQLGFSPQEFTEVLKFWDSEMQYSKSSLFPGVVDNLRRWSQHYPLAIVSTTPARMIRERLQVDNLEAYFTLITGAEDGGTEKRERVRTTLQALGAEGGVMVGDTPLDIDAGRFNGLETVGVTYGWVSGARISAEGPTRLVDSPADLGDVVIEVMEA